VEIFASKYFLSIVLAVLQGVISHTVSDSMDRHKEKFSNPVVVENWKHNSPSFESLKVPSFVTQVPKGHFAGVSEPYDTLAKARKAALNDVIIQVLACNGVKVEHSYIDSAKGNAGLKVSGKEKKFMDHLLGADIEANAILRGHDEIGRIVTARVDF